MCFEWSMSPGDPALFQFTVAPQSRQGIACVRGRLPAQVFAGVTARGTCVFLISSPPPILPCNSCAHHLHLLRVEILRTLRRQTTQEWLDL